MFGDRYRRHVRRGAKVINRVNKLYKKGDDKSIIKAEKLKVRFFGENKKVLRGKLFMAMISNASYLRR